MKFLRGLTLAVFLILWAAGIAQAVEDYSYKGKINSPGFYRYTIKCDPGEKFEVVISSDRETSAELFYKYLAGSEYAYSLKQDGEVKARHIIKYAAPMEKPEHNMTHWHYEVRVIPATREETSFSIKIIPGGRVEVSTLDRISGLWTGSSGPVGINIYLDIDRKFYALELKEEGQYLSFEYLISDAVEESGVVNITAVPTKCWARGAGISGGYRELPLPSSNQHLKFRLENGGLICETGGKTFGPLYKK